MGRVYMSLDPKKLQKNESESDVNHTSTVKQESQDQHQANTPDQDRQIPSTRQVPLSDKAKFICFFGKRGSGKTTSIRGQLFDCRPPVVILDILGNFDDPTYFHTEKISDAILELNNQIKKDEFKIICLKTADPNLAVDYLSAALYEANGGTLILDEVDAFNFSEASCFDQLIRYGRNKNVSVITGCRRPAEVHRNITAAANKLFVLKTNEPRDIDYYSATLFGERAYELMRLPDFHGLFLDYDQNTLGVFKIDEQGKIYILKSEQI